MTMRYFLLTGGEEERSWWTIGTNGYNRIVVCTAHDSSPGQVETIRCTRDDVQQRVDQFIADKRAAGYAEDKTPWHGGFESPLRQSLEDAIAEDPDDLASHMAYADHLVELGDPRGELIQVQLALEDEKLSAAKRKKLQAREEALLKQHARTWLGPMAAYWIDKLDGPLSEYTPANCRTRSPGGEAGFIRWG
jgi:uncharacterized protein (TIGR02996 family)